MGDPKKEKAPHALDELVARSGKNNPKLLDAILAGTSNEELVADGATIATARLLVDGQRLYGEALDFYDRATATQKKLLRGVSGPLLSVAIHHLDALRKLEASNAEDAKGNTTSRVVTDHEVQDAVTQAVVLRDQAYASMKDVAGSSKPLLARLDEAFATADPPANLAKGLDEIAGLLTEWATANDTALRTRMDLANLDKAYAAELVEAALAVRTAVAAAAKRTSPKAKQHTLDREDGVQILLLGQIIRAFENAHGRDATIPRLVPISTRRLFNRNKRSAAPGDTAAPPATP